VETPGIWSLQVLESPGKSVLMSVRTLVLIARQWQCAVQHWSPSTLSCILPGFLPGFPPVRRRTQCTGCHMTRTKSMQQFV